MGELSTDADRDADRDAQRVAASLADWLAAVTFADRSTEQVTALLVDSTVAWAEGQGWKVYRRAASVLPLPPPYQHRHSYLDVACARPGGAPIAIEIDHTDRRRTVDKLLAEAAEGRIAIWVRWGTRRFEPPPPPVLMVTCPVTSRPGADRSGMDPRTRLYSRMPATRRPAPGHTPVDLHAAQQPRPVHLTHPIPTYSEPDSAPCPTRTGSDITARARTGASGVMTGTAHTPSRPAPPDQGVTPTAPPTGSPTGAPTPSPPGLARRVWRLTTGTKGVTTGTSGRNRAADATAYLSYLALTVWCTARLWPGLGDRVIDGNHGGNEDYRLFEWNLAYAAHALRHLQNPFFSTLENAPTGVNLMSNTGVVGLGIPLAPVTWLAGPTVTANLVICLALFGTAACWYWVLSRRVVASRLAAAVGGALCGFGPGMVAHSRGHLNLIAQFLLPLIVAAALRLAEPGSPVRRGVLLGMLVAWQALIGEEVLLFFAAGAVIFTLACAAQRRRQARVVGRRVLAGFGVAAGVGALLLAYPLWIQFFGPQSFRTVPYVSGYGADLASYVATPQLAVDGSRAANAGLALNPTEENTFFTIPLVVLVANACVWLWRARSPWRRVVVRALVATAAALALLSLGPTLKVGGHDTGVPLPWRVLERLPVLDSVLPARFGLMILVAFAVLVALGVDAAVGRLRAAGIRGPRIAVVGLLAVVLLPLAPRPLPVIPVGYPVPAFVASGQWRGYVRDGRTLVPVPFPDAGDASGQRWAAVTGVPFAVPGGYFLGPGPDGRGRFGPVPRPTSELLLRVAATGQVPDITDADRARAATDLAYWRADVVVLGRHRYAGALRTTLDALLGPGQRVSDVWVWNVRDLA